MGLLTTAQMTVISGGRRSSRRIARRVGLGLWLITGFGYGYGIPAYLGSGFLALAIAIPLSIYLLARVRLGWASVVAGATGIAAGVLLAFFLAS